MVPAGLPERLGDDPGQADGQARPDRLSVTRRLLLEDRLHAARHVAIHEPPAFLGRETILEQTLEAGSAELHAEDLPPAESPTEQLLRLRLEDAAHAPDEEPHGVVRGPDPAKGRPDAESAVPARRERHLADHRLRHVREDQVPPPRELPVHVRPPRATVVLDPPAILRVRLLAALVPGRLEARTQVLGRDPEQRGQGGEVALGAPLEGGAGAVRAPCRRALTPRDRRPAARLAPIRVRVERAPPDHEVELEPVLGQDPTVPVEESAAARGKPDLAVPQPVRLGPPPRRFDDLVLEEADEEQQEVHASEKEHDPEPTPEHRRPSPGSRPGFPPSRPPTRRRGRQSP